MIIIDYDYDDYDQHYYCNIVSLIILLLLLCLDNIRDRNSTGTIHYHPPLNLLAMIRMTLRKENSLMSILTPAQVLMRKRNQNRLDGRRGTYALYADVHSMYPFN